MSADTSVLSLLSVSIGVLILAAVGLAEPPRVTTNSVGMKLIEIPAGEFKMGSHETPKQIKTAFPDDQHDEEFFLDDRPQHRVRITRPFYLAKHEVTVGQFRRFAEATGYVTEAEKDGEGGWGLNPTTRFVEGRRPQYSWRDPGFSQSDDHPVLNVTWNDAMAFIRWLSLVEKVEYRLPNEAEWEYACRAGTEGRFQGNDDPDALLKTARVLDARRLHTLKHIDEIPIPDDGSVPFTAAVGSFPPNAFGLSDMLGNVWEWTADYYDEHYYANSPTDDPPGPATGPLRVRRGGAWNSYPIWARACFRNWNTAATRCCNLGFRVAANTVPVRESVSILIAGDIMLDGGPGHHIAHGGDPFIHFRSILPKADLTIGNLECSLAEHGEVLHKAYTFRAATGSLPLVRQYFDAVSLANNHAMDFGREEFVKQLAMMEQQRSPFFGGGRDKASARRPLVMERNGFRIALLGYNGFNIEDYGATADRCGTAPMVVEEMIADITAARQQGKADIVIPYLHWGDELNPAPNRQQQVIARRLIEAGASAVIGAHPHVTQTIEIYRGRPIVYSLGNFVFDYFPLDPKLWIGWLARLQVDRNNTVDLQIIPLEIDRTGIPKPIAE